MNISDHKTYEEAIRSKKAEELGIDNFPDSHQLANMIITATKLFEPVRTNFDVPIYVASFFRSKELNKVIGGSSTSDHMTGEAMDVDASEYGRLTNKNIFEYVKDNLDFDQLIAENVTDNKWADFGWVHFSYKSVDNRNEVLLSEMLNGKMKYYTYNHNKGFDIKLYRNG